MLRYNRWIKKHVTSKHFFVVVNNIQMPHDFTNNCISNKYMVPKLNAWVKF
jgi:hypothetical protein